jgi:hypothetical protein
MKTLLLLLLALQTTNPHTTPIGTETIYKGTVVSTTDEGHTILLRVCKTKHDCVWSRIKKHSDVKVIPQKGDEVLIKGTVVHN